MELRHLRYFIGVAEELHFGRAAARLHIEQSPLSRAIKELEHDLGVQLFERSTRTINLTRAGEVLLKEARHILNEAKNAREKVCATAQANNEPALRVVVTDGLVQPQLMKLLGHCRIATPALAVRLQEMTVQQLHEGLRRGDIDLGFSLCGDFEEGLCIQPVWRDKVSLVLPVNHPLSAQDSVRLEQITAYPLVSYDEKLCRGSHKNIEYIIKTLGDPIHVAACVSGYEEMLLRVGAGYGIGFVLLSQVERFLHPEIVIRPLDDYEHYATTYALFLQAGASKEIMQLIQYARQIGLLETRSDN